MSGTAQTPAPPPLPTPQTPFAGLIAEYLRRDANGHSPAPDEIAAMAALKPTPDPASIHDAMPFLLRALENPDIPLHSFALTTLAGLETAPLPEPEPAPVTTPPSDGSSLPAPTLVPAPIGPSTYKPEVVKVLATYIPQIAAHLSSEDATPNRILVTAILGAFTPNPPAAVYSPLLAFLKRDDAVGAVGLAVVADLLQLGPLSDEAAAAITRFLRRSDQTADSRANLADLIATNRNQSRPVNRSLLLFLNSDDQSLRARIILSLPGLDLGPDVFADTKSRIEQIAGNPNESLQVVTAAKSIASCWTAPKMTANCPVY